MYANVIKEELRRFECLMNLVRGVTAAIGRGARRTLRIEDRHGKVKLRAAASVALDPDAARVIFHQMFGDGKSQSGAAHFARPGHIHPVKPLKNSRLVRLRDTDSGVRDRKNYFA